MTTWHPRLWRDIRFRGISDATLTGIVSDFTQQWIAEGTSMPYCCYRVESNSTEEAFNEKAWNITLDVHIFVEAEHPTGGDPLSTVSVLMDRVSGDWLDQANRTPTYGFDRWTPGLTTVSGWTASPFVHTSTLNNDEPGVYHRVQRFEGLVASVR